MPLQDGNTVYNGGGTYVPPDYTPPDDSFGGSTGGGSIAGIGDMVGAVTPWRAVNFAAKSGSPENLGGVFQILAISAKSITLADPTDTNAAWLALGTDSTAFFSPVLATSGERWIGPFTIDMADCEEVVANFICPQGLFRTDDEGKPRSQSVAGVVEVTPINADGTPRGAAVEFPLTLSNSPQDDKDDDKEPTIDKSPRGKTRRAILADAAKGRVSVRFRRTTPLPEYDKDQFIDELAIRDCYGLGPITNDDFGNVTTVHTRVQATSGATSVKERKLQCVVTRKVPQRNADNTFGPALIPSRNAADIICAMALDPFIGGRTLGELNVPQIYDTIGEVQDYFGFLEAGFFDYTFDEDNTSFEEMVQTVAFTVFCNAYRQGSVLNLFFERETDTSTLLLNHRNKLPGSEKRTVRFGPLDDNDAVELEYRDSDGQQQTVFFPPEGGAKPKKIERAGITDSRVATIYAARAWNKIRYQNITVEFEATAEASQLILNERVEITDNTRPDVVDGYIVLQDGLVVELSQPFEDTPGSFVMFIQLPTGAVDVIPVTRVDDYHALLSRAPTEPLALDPNNWADVTYQIVTATNPPATGFLIAEKGAFDRRSVRLQAINYDPRYYQNDHDFA